MANENHCDLNVAPFSLFLPFSPSRSLFLSFSRTRSLSLLFYLCYTSRPFVLPIKRIRPKRWDSRCLNSAGLCACMHNGTNFLESCLSTHFFFFFFFIRWQKCSFYRLHSSFLPRLSEILIEFRTKICNKIWNKFVLFTFFFHFFIFFISSAIITLL